MSTTARPSAATEVAHWLERFDSALQAGDAAAAADLFATESYWRDLVAFTWNIRTVEGREGVADMLAGGAAAHPAARLAHDRGAGERRRRHRGVARLRDRGGPRQRPPPPDRRQGVDAADRAGRAQGPRGAPRAPGGPRACSTARDPDRETWLEDRQREAEELGFSTQPYVVIVGGGQGGIALGARLRQLGVPAIIVERNPRPGDSWRNRYKSLCLHDPVWYDHLPYVKFPPTWPVFSPKDKVADWLEMYTRVMELNYWGSTQARRAHYDEAAGEWELVVERDGSELTLRPKQLVLATGMSGRPHTPSFPGADGVRRRSAPLVQAPRPRRLPGQAGRGDRLQQLRPRHLRGAVGARRRRDHGAALLDARGPLGHADGDRARRPVLRAGGGRRGQHREGRHDLRLAALPDHGRAPGPRLRADPRARRRLLRAAGGGRVPARLGRGRVGPVHEVPAPRVGLLHRRGRLGAGRRRPDQAPGRPGRPPHARRGGDGRRHRTARRRGRLRHRLCSR